MINKDYAEATRSRALNHESSTEIRSGDSKGTNSEANPGTITTLGFQIHQKEIYRSNINDKTPKYCATQTYTHNHACS